jgi:chromosome partitioning protein
VGTHFLDNAGELRDAGCMFTIAFCGQKGGIGKTTAATNVSAELVVHGYRVLLVDADPQGAASTWVKKARVRCSPAAPELVRGDETMHRELPPRAAQFDIMIIDCPGCLSRVVRSALAIADLAILPCGSGGFDGQSFVETVKEVRKAQRIRPQLEARALVSRVDMRRAIGRSVHGVIQQAISIACSEMEGGDVVAARTAAAIPVLQSMLLDRTEFEEASWEAESVTSWAPASRAADEVRQLVNEVLNLGRRYGGTTKTKYQHHKNGAHVGGR